MFGHVAPDLRVLSHLECIWILNPGGGGSRLRPNNKAIERKADGGRPGRVGNVGELDQYQLHPPASSQRSRFAQRASQVLVLCVDQGGPRQPLGRLFCLLKAFVEALRSCQGSAAFQQAQRLVRVELLQEGP